MSQKVLITLDDDIAEWLNGYAQNKSDTVRKALLSYRDGISVSSSIDKLSRLINMRFDALEQPEKVSDSEVPKDALSPLNLGMACCTLHKPCRHWHFDDVNTIWVNELTKQTREV